MKSLHAALFIFALGLASLWPQQLLSAPVRDGAVEIELIAEVESIEPGKPFTVGLKFEIDPTWHIYWINPGGPGFPPKVAWTLPEGFVAGPLEFPTPHHFFAAGSEGYGYEGHAVLLAEITPPASLKPGKKVTLAGKAEWLACADACVPGSAELSLELQTAAAAAAGPQAGLIAETRQQLPTPVDWNISAEIDMDAKTARYFIDHGGAVKSIDGLYFFPAGYANYASLTDPNELAKFTLEGEKLTVDCVVNKYYSGDPPEWPEAVLTSETGFGGDLGKSVWISNAPKPDPLAVTTPAAADPAGDTDAGGAKSDLTFWTALLFAFIGGLILNVMPCVFPVISLKILGFVQQAGEDRRKIAIHGFAFAAGVLIFFWLVVGILLGVRSALGTSAVAWGSQFQSPIFVMIMGFVILLIALNLFGVFEIGMGLTSVGGKLSSSTGYAGSFWSGSLAVILATPCTAPFMGGAVAYALNAPIAATFTVFTVMGLGMASPYILLSLSPGLINALPKPGAWMEKFKQFMGFPMIAVVFFLVWVAAHQLDTTGLGWFFVGLTLLSLGMWWFGSFATPMQGATTRIVARAAAVVFVSLGVWTTFKASTYPAPAKIQDVEAVIAKSQAEGKKVFVDFTAAWCLICQSNKAAMHSEAVETAFKEQNVEFLEVDWTSKDPEILKVLQKYGAEGVPLYLIFDSDPSKEPIKLPNTLTKGIILDSLDKL